MANSRVKAAGWSSNEILTSAQANSLDIGQYRALTRTGTTALLGNTTIEGGGYQLLLDFTDNGASNGAIQIADQNFTFTSTGSGRFVFPGDDIEFTGGTWPVLSSRTLRRTQHGAALNTTSTFAWNTVAGCYLQTQIDGELYMALTNLIDGATMTDVRVRLAGQSSAGHVSLPATMPRLEVYKVSGTTGTKTQLGTTATDASPDVSSFNAAHSLIRSALTEVIDQSTGDAYHIRFRGAGGANYVNNELIVIGVDINFTVTSLRC